MPTPELPLMGGCRCGQVRFRIDAAPLLTLACHCTGCQRMSASAYSLSVALPAEGFEVTQGEPAIGGLHGSPKHFFCPSCMSWMFTRPDEAGWLVNVRATLLDDTAWFAPFVETFTCEALAWAKTPAKHSYARFPPVEDYERLTREFAAG